MSGDFDAIGLGLFNSPAHSVPNPSHVRSLPPPPPPIFSMSDDLDKHYHFNNTEDFQNNTTQSFAFPTNKDSNIFANPPLPQSNKFHNHSNSLNSPIRLQQKRSSSGLQQQQQQQQQSTPNQPRFFLTNDTTVNKDNVPNAIIDLDDIFKANMHIGDYTTETPTRSSQPVHKRTESAPANFYYDDFLGSPFIKESPIKEEEEKLEVNFEEEESEEDEEDIVDNVSDEALPPPSFYQSPSANSSNSSLKTKMIEKTLSNSSSNSFFGTPRSGAKASRYQVFYDHSKLISNAMKNSSENVSGIERAVTPPLNRNPININTTNSKYLNHSSSLPSLKGKRSFSHAPMMRYSEAKRISSPRSTPTMNTNTLQTSIESTSSPSSKSPETQYILEPPAASTPSTSATTLTIMSHNSDTKDGRKSASPVSIHSEVLESTTPSATSTIDTTTSNMAEDITANTTSTSATTAAPSIIITNDLTAKKTKNTNNLYINTNISSSDDSNTMEKSASTIIHSSGNSTPLYAPSLSPTNTTTAVTQPPMASQFTTATTPKQEGFESPKSPHAPRRPESPAQKKILKETKIPVFKKTNAFRNSHTNNSSLSPNTSPPKPLYVDKSDLKHRSFLRRGSNATDISTTSSISSRLKRSSRIFDWLRKK
ncbi:hypothetical protein SBY92_003597 [Candida maltosa Xu316]